MKHRIKRLLHKYGVELPIYVQYAYEIDWSNNNTLWQDDINKEMGNLKVAFDIFEQGCKYPPRYSKPSDHMIFDVRMTLERKDRWVKDGHMIP